jgi:GNAT superfamily N-acetyltransferase
MISIISATPDHALGMSQLLHSILKRWNSPRPYSPEHVRAYYISPEDGIKCSVALKDDKVVGFQALLLATEGNAYEVTPGWGIIGTYVDGSEAGQGIGRKLFASSLDAARKIGLPAIDATIGDWNDEGLGYYGAMGFETYRTPAGAVSKKFTLA